MLNEMVAEGVAPTAITWSTLMAAEAAAGNLAAAEGVLAEMRALRHEPYAFSYTALLGAQVLPALDSLPSPACPVCHRPAGDELSSASPHHAARGLSTPATGPSTPNRTEGRACNRAFGRALSSDLRQPATMPGLPSPWSHAAGSVLEHSCQFGTSDALPVSRTSVCRRGRGALTCAAPQRHAWRR